MNKLVKLTKEFEGYKLTTLTFKGKPCWIAKARRKNNFRFWHPIFGPSLVAAQSRNPQRRHGNAGGFVHSHQPNLTQILAPNSGSYSCASPKEIGNALGYANGSRLVSKINLEWRNEFIETQDYFVVSGKELADFKELFTSSKDLPDSGITYTGRLMLLFESGLHLALTKTNKPVGVRLRRFLATEVLPRIARDGSYLPEQSGVEKKIPKSDPTTQRRLAIAEAREARLGRKQKEDSMRRLVEELKQSGLYSKGVIMSYIIAASELGTDKDFSILKPKNREEDWVTPTQIAAQLGVSINRVGRVITILNLRGNIAGLAKAIVNTAKNHDRTVTSYLYSPEAVRMIQDELGISQIINYKECHNREGLLN